MSRDLCWVCLVWCVQNPFLHISHRLPSTLGLQWHRPDSNPLIKSVLESHIPSSKEPPGSQSHATSNTILWWCWFIFKICVLYFKNYSKILFNNVINIFLSYLKKNTCLKTRGFPYRNFIEFIRNYFQNKRTYKLSKLI